MLSCAVLVALALVVVAGSAVWVARSAEGRLFSVASVPAAPVALVLGAQVYPDGTPSPFVVARLTLAQQLYAAGKVRAILVSGDHGAWAYDEPGAMARWLVAHGVPPIKVVQDHAGFDTYDSCVRARRVFGVRRLIVVTQQYHVARAVAICRRVGVVADGVGDRTAEQFAEPWRRGARREYGANVKAVYDVVSGRNPVFLGRHETGIDQALAP